MANTTQWEDLLVQFILEGHSPPRVENLVLSILDCPTHPDLDTQLEFLSKVSNYHWLCYNHQSKTHLCFAQHLCFDPTAEENPNGWLKYQHQPNSPRNILQLGAKNWGDDDTQAKVFKVLSYILDFDQKVEKTADDFDFFLQGFGNDHPEPLPDTDPAPPPKKRRKAKARVVTATPAAVCNHMGIPPVESTTVNRSMYNIFAEALATEGEIMWRHHSPDADVVLLNDYSNTTGEFLPNSFVHLTAQREEDSENICSLVPAGSTTSCRMQQVTQALMKTCFWTLLCSLACTADFLKSHCCLTSQSLLKMKASLKPTCLQK